MMLARIAVLLLLMFLCVNWVQAVDKEIDKTYKKDKAFTGERLSLNFRDIEVRAVLQIIADFSHFNLIASDTVKGNITLRLEEVPWDQALDIILKTKGLDKRQVGNVLLVGPAEEISVREKLELESRKQTEDLGILLSAVIQIKYAKAEDLALMLKDKSNSLMTARGSVAIDKRTNTLLLQDTEQKLREIRAVLAKLDVPVRQVEISTQIITSDCAIEEALGVRFSSVNNSTANPQERLFSDLGSNTTGAGLGKIGFSIAKLPHGTLLDLELQALEYESKIKTISRPKLLTVDQHRASVEQGVEIPYQESTSSGAASVAFKKAVLRLEVTPHITPDDKITLDLLISSDTPDNSIQTQNPGTGSTSRVIGLKTNRLLTKVLANNNETIVLGGVLTMTETKNQGRVPWIAEIPVLGALFRNKYTKEEKKELLIFITPKIVSTKERT